MATRSQRRKEKHKRKRKEKKQQQQGKRQENRQRTPDVRAQDVPSGSHARHRQRLLAQVPKAWPGERPEDAAVFDDAVLEKLPSELADQVAAVREALKAACDFLGEEAVKRTASIPRSSPLSDWRLFVRGLVSWLEGDAESAGEAWRRLDADRRPGRIAAAMMNALRTDLDQARIEPASDEKSPGEWPDRLDEPLLYHAKLLRRVRFDRSAVKIAEAGLRIPDESKKLLIGPRKLRWLQRFSAEYRETEPELVAALQQTALLRAYAQNFDDVFSDAIKMFEGPRHDRRNQLLGFFYYMRFTGDSYSEKTAERFLERYLKEDLPRNEALSEPLRAAIASQIHLAEAFVLLEPRGGGFMSFLFEEPEDTKSIRKYLKASIKAYPANRAAHRRYADWIESKLDRERLTQKERKPLNEELAKVMTAWSQALPEDVRPRLWLVDYLLENEQMEEAKPHVDWLAGARQDDPRVRATPWKWQLLEAMRLCRRKAWLSEVPARLEEAERLWPAWLSKEWLPYLKAAVTLRAGDTEALEAERKQICEDSGLVRDSLPDACMMLGAAQQMRVPAKDLKPLRAPVDEAVKKLSQVSDEELLRVSGFFWDLHRTQLLYPAYRMHGSKIANEIAALLWENPRYVLDHRDDSEIHTAVLLCSEHRCFQMNYELKFPSWFSNPAVSRHPMFAAAKLNAFLKLSHHWRPERFENEGQFLREAAKSERDAYYRYWFAALADELDEVLAKKSAGPFGSGFNPFFEMFEADDDEDELPFDPDCDCPDCRAARRAYEASR